MKKTLLSYIMAGVLSAGALYSGEIKLPENASPERKAVAEYVNVMQDYQKYLVSKIEEAKDGKNNRYSGSTEIFKEELRALKVEIEWGVEVEINIETDISKRIKVPPEFIDNIKKETKKLRESLKETRGRDRRYEELTRIIETKINIP